jgi:hypothetical protein
VACGAGNVVAFGMPSSEGDATAWLGKLTEKFARARFPPGVIGKSSYVIIALLILLALIAWRLPSDSWSSPLLGIGLVAVLVVIWWVYLRMIPATGPGHGGDAARVERLSDTPQARYAGGL